jgi:hypothetical protein
MSRRLATACNAFGPLRRAVADESTVTFVGATGGAGTQTVALPAGWQAGDLAVAFLWGTTSTPAAPTGWTSIATTSATPRGRAVYRVLQAGDGGVTGASSNQNTRIQVYRGQRSTGPIGASAVVNGSCSTAVIRSWTMVCA